MLRTVAFFFWLLFYMVRLVPTRLRVVWLNHRGRREECRALVDKTVLKWSRKAMKYSGVRLTVKGWENLPPEHQNVIFVPNHQSFLDIPIVLAGLGRSFPLMAKHVMCRVPFIRGWMKTLRCAIVKPGNVATQIAAMRKSRKLLGEGQSLVIFPEGRRSEGREMLPFLPAAFSLACRTDTPVVPIAIDGCDLNFDCNGWRICDTEVVLNILPMIETKYLSAAQRRDLPQRAAEEIKATLGAGAYSSSA